MQESTKKILIIEDEKALRSALQDKFGRTNKNLEIFAAKNGEEGLKLALAEHPDIIILDIYMPKMNGIEMLQELRKDEWGKDAEVIILTNSLGKKSIEQSLAHGAFEYFVKSDWKISDLTERVLDRLS